MDEKGNKDSLLYWYNQHDFFDRSVVLEFLSKHKQDLLFKICADKYNITDEHIWQDVCNISDEIINMRKKKTKWKLFPKAFNNVISKNNITLENWENKLKDKQYRSLMWSLVNIFRSYQRRLYIEDMEEAISKTLNEKTTINRSEDYEWLVESQFGWAFIAMFDSLVGKMLPEENRPAAKSLVVQEIIDMINNKKIPSLNLRIEPGSTDEDLLQRFAIDRYDNDWELKEFIKLIWEDVVLKFKNLIEEKLPEMSPLSSLIDYCLDVINKEHNLQLNPEERERLELMGWKYYDRIKKDIEGR